MPPGIARLATAHTAVHCHLDRAEGTPPCSATLPLGPRPHRRLNQAATHLHHPEANSGLCNRRLDICSALHRTAARYSENHPPAPFRSAPAVTAGLPRVTARINKYVKPFKWEELAIHPVTRTLYIFGLLLSVSERN